MKSREAMADDFPEVLRLAHLLWTDMGLDIMRGVSTTHGDWEADAAVFFVEGLTSGTLKAFVVDHPSNDGVLISCGIGVIMKQMPAFWLPTGQMGYVQWFATQSDFRRQGMATEILQRLIEWFESEGIIRVQLHGSEEAISVYRKAGFVDTSYSNLWLRMTP